MRSYVEILIILPLLVLCYQLYSFSVNSTEQKRQERCQNLGIILMTFGITALVFRSPPSAFFGLILIMFGFRLIARGLDRFDKSIFIDRYDGDK
jgi:hypothetical protein